MTAKRTRRPARPTVPPAAAETADDTEETLTDGAGQDSEQADAELAELGAQMPEGALLTLWRFDDHGQKEWLAEQPVAGFTLPSVAQRFGGGNFIIYLRKPDPEAIGRWVRQGSKRFRIGGAPREPVAEPAAVIAGVAPGAAELEKLTRLYGESIQASVKASIDNANLLQQMQLAVIKSLSDARPAAATGPTITEILMIIDKMTGGRNAGPSVADVIALADKMSNRNSPTSQLKETMEVIAAARDFAGGESAAPPWMNVAAKALDVIGRAVQYNPRQLPSGEAVVVTDTPPPATPAPATVEIPTVPETSHPLLKWLAPQLPILVAHAQADHDPDTYAGVLVDAIAPQHAADVLAFLEAPDFLPQLVAAFPMTQPLQEWFGELRDNVVDRLRDLLTPPTEPAGDAPAVA